MNAAGAAPVFVLGPERSGANLLAASLGQHPSFTSALSSRWLGAFLADLSRAFEDATATDRTQLGRRGVTRAEFYGTFGDAAGQLLTGPARGPAPVRLVDATPEHAFHVFALRWLFPQARFIHMVRNVSSVVRLLLDRDISKLFRTYYGERKAYEHWLSTVRACVGAEQALGSDVVLRVLHRDLATDPKETMERCLGFLGEEWHGACLRPLDGIVADPEHLPDDESDGAELPFRDQAHELSRTLLEAPAPSYPPDPVLIEELERAAPELHRRQTAVADIDALVARVRSTMEAIIPAEGRALVVSRGDNRLLQVSGRTAGHFPQGEDGQYLGYHPADSADAITRLEEMRQRGAQFLVIPSTSFWWLDHYRDFRKHLDGRYAVVSHQPDVCVIYSLDPEARVGLDLRSTAASTADQSSWRDALALRLEGLEAEIVALRSQLAGTTNGRTTR